MPDDSQCQLLRAQLAYLDERKTRAREETARAIERLTTLQSKLKSIEDVPNYTGSPDKV